MRDSGDVCGARNTQFEQEFLGLFRAKTVSAYDWRDRIGDFCVADYLAEDYTVHVVRYSTRFSLHLSRTSSCLPTSDNHGERMLSASATASVATPLGSDYSRNLLAARRIGALWACCLRCFAEASSRRDVSRFGFPTEGLPPKSCLRVCLSMGERR